MSILHQIIATKKEELAFFKPLCSIQRFIDEGFYWHATRRSLFDALISANTSGIIAEFKRKSPSKGWFNEDIEPQQVIPFYDASAAAISILTDEQYFGGSLDDLLATRQLTTRPILRKDFIIDAWQIAEARSFGADVILLIASCLTPMQVKDLSAAAKAYQMEVILELHDENEIGHICEDTLMIGINNRNLNTFQVDIEQSIRMSQQIPKGKILIAESGIQSVDEVRHFRKNGFSGFLAGEVFMKQSNPGEAFQQFVKNLEA